MLAAQPSPVGTRAHDPMDFGRQNDIVARGHLTEVKPGDLFAQAGRVNIGGVEEVDSRIQRQREMLARILFVDVPSASTLCPGWHLAAAVAHASQTNAGHRDSSL